jgi:hypothetical protein
MIASGLITNIGWLPDIRRAIKGALDRVISCYLPS